MPTARGSSIRVLRYTRPLERKGEEGRGRVELTFTNVPCADYGVRMSDARYRMV